MKDTIEELPKALYQEAPMILGDHTFVSLVNGKPNIAKYAFKLEPLRQVGIDKYHDLFIILANKSISTTGGMLWL